MSTETPNPTTAIAVADTNGRAMLTIDQVVQNREAVLQLMSAVMKEGVHYGKVPGCGDKPTLLQPGAQALLQLFNCGPRFETKITTLDRGHRLVEVTCKAVHHGTGAVVGEGLGVCSTMERKYRFRKMNRHCPACGGAFIRKGRDEYGGGWYCAARDGGCGAKFPDGDESIENQKAGEVEYDNPFDYYNTVGKIACKRAAVHVALNLTGASELFTQDLEDGQDTEDARDTDVVEADEKRPASKKVHSTSSPAPKTEPKPDQAKKPDAPEPEIVKPVADGQCRATIVRIKELWKSAPGAARPGALTGITIERDGRHMQTSTFETALVAVAREAQQSKAIVLCAWKINTEGKVTLTKCEPAGPAQRTTDIPPRESAAGTGPAAGAGRQTAPASTAAARPTGASQANTIVTVTIENVEHFDDSSSGAIRRRYKLTCRDATNRRIPVNTLRAALAATADDARDTGGWVEIEYSTNPVSKVNELVSLRAVNLRDGEPNGQRVVEISEEDIPF